MSTGNLGKATRLQSAYMNPNVISYFRFFNQCFSSRICVLHSYKISFKKYIPIKDTVDSPCQGKCAIYIESSNNPYACCRGDLRHRGVLLRPRVPHPDLQRRPVRAHCSKLFQGEGGDPPHAAECHRRQVQEKIPSGQKQVRAASGVGPA